MDEIETDQNVDNDMREGKEHENGAYEQVQAEHDYYIPLVDGKLTNKRIKGPYSMEKEQINYDQIKRTKMVKIDMFSEKCKLCQKVFTSVTEIDIHVRRQSCEKIDSEKKKQTQVTSCNECNQEFESCDKFRMHYELEHLEKSWECPHCSKWFKRKRDWQRHKRESHEPDAKKFNCENVILALKEVMI